MAWVKVTFFGLALFYIAYDLEWSTFFNVMGDVTWQQIVMVLICNFAGFYMLAYRWYVMTKRQIGFKASLETTFVCLSVNNITPVKAGEVAKTFYLKKYYGLPMARSFPLMMIERLLDLFFMGLLVVWISLEYSAVHVNVLLAALLTGVAVLYLWIRRTRWSLKLVRRYSPRKSRRFISEMVKTTARITRKEWGTYMVLTALLWLLYCSGSVVFFIFSETVSLPISAIIVFFVFSAFGMVLPSTPGGIGVVQASGVFALSLFGVDKEMALGITLILHMLQYLPTTFIGILILYAKDFKIKPEVWSKYG